MRAFVVLYPANGFLSPLNDVYSNDPARFIYLNYPRSTRAVGAGVFPGRVLGVAYPLDE